MRCTKNMAIFSAFELSQLMLSLYLQPTICARYLHLKGNIRSIRYRQHGCISIRNLTFNVAYFSCKYAPPSTRLHSLSWKFNDSLVGTTRNGSNIVKSWINLCWETLNGRSNWLKWLVITSWVNWSEQLISRIQSSSRISRMNSTSGQLIVSF